MKLIFLMGMPGAGKTYWGRKVAASLKLSFEDLDEYIEKKMCADIPDIFRQYGEDGFRKIETTMLKALIGESKVSTVIACGGGTPVFNNNLQLMQNAGCTVYLKVGIETMLQHLLADDRQRPLLQQGESPAILAQLLEARKEKFEQADYVLDEEAISVANFAEIIARCTDRPY